MINTSNQAFRDSLNRLKDAVYMRSKFISLTFALDHLSDEVYKKYETYVEDLSEYFDECVSSTFVDFEAALGAAREKGELGNHVAEQ